jgi:hypothetical protein
VTWDVDLSDPKRLAFLLDGYLCLGVVPVEGPPPPVLAQGTLRLVLPAGRVHEGPARVIRPSGPKSFLVQADGLPDAAALRALAQTSATPAVPAAASAAPRAPKPPSLLDELVSTIDPLAELAFPGVVDRPEAPPPPPPAPVLPPIPPPRPTPAPAPVAPAWPTPPPTPIPPAWPSPVPTPAPVPLDTESVRRAALQELKSALQDPTPPAPRDSRIQPRPDVEAPDAPASTHRPHSGLFPHVIVEGPPASPSPAAPDAPAPRGGEVTGKESEYSDAYAKVKDLPLQEKQRLARHGRRTVRQILMRDPNKTLQRLVLANPDIGLDEVQEYAGWPGLTRDALEFIANHTTWMASRMMLLAVIKNPSAPMELAMRLVPRLGPAEWRLLVRPGVVRTPIQTAARRALEASRDS